MVISSPSKAIQDSDLHDLSDDADYAASLQQETCSSMKAGDGSEKVVAADGAGSDPVEVLFLKNNVAIHPTQYASERISGRLKLFEQGGSIFLSWIPYKGQTSNPKLLEKDRNLYTIKAVPLTEIRSIRRHTPTFGWQYVIIVLSSGLAFPPLYFYNGGVKEFLLTVKQHVFIVRSAEDANVFLVNDFQDPLQKTLSSLELPVSIAGGPSITDSLMDTTSYKEEDCNGKYQNKSSGFADSFERERIKNQDPARELSINVLEKFSLVTKFARDTTLQLFNEGSANGFGSIKRKKETKYHGNNNEKEFSDEENVLNEDVVPEDPVEVEKLSLVWGNPREAPLGYEEWIAFMDSEGRVLDSTTLKKRIFYGGVVQQLRKEVWTFLLGYYPFDSTYAEREYLKCSKKSEYETLKQQWQSVSPEQAKRFTKFRERKGLIEKDVVRTDRSVSFYDGDDNPNVDTLRDILMTYSFYNFDLGYCQGMSDLLSPILFVLNDESESFWCFVGLMERLGPNFNRDQNGMHSQLFALSKLVELLDVPLHNYFKQNDCLNYFFCFRWVLIQFKREFEYEKILRLWEILWTQHRSEHFHLYVCVAILKRYRKKIIGERMDFDTLLKFINELSGRIELESVLRDAEALCVCAGENGAACIPPGTPPSLPIDTDNSFLSSHHDDVL